MTHSPVPHVYLAGPDVFYADARARQARHLDICHHLGLRALVPVDNEPPQGTPREQALGIYRGNLAKMEQADAILAIITPFRGPHMVPGSDFEIGFFVARGKPVVCYSEAPSALADRVLSWSAQPRAHGAPAQRDKDGALIEDFGLQENLMIEGALSHRPLGHGIDATQVLSCFDGFEPAARALVAYFNALVG